MGFKVIKGTFHITGYSPDGDSIRFKADFPDSWNKLKGNPVKLNRKNHAQLRIEAIDTLETHYNGVHQPLELAIEATDRLFKILGIQNVKWNEKHTKVISADDNVEGYILCRFVEKYGRPVSFVFSNDINLDGLEDVYLDNKLASLSVNYSMIQHGLAYPTFYDGMFYDLREFFAEATQISRQNKMGVWGVDGTNSFFKVKTLKDISDSIVLMPKVFRRLVDYLKKHNKFDPVDFVQKLSEREEKVLLVNILHFTYFHKLYQIENNDKLKMVQNPENLVFLG